MPTRFPIRLAPVLISILLLGPMAGLRAQPQHGGSPAGLAAKKPLEAAHVRRFPALDMAKIAEEDAQWAAAHAGSELTGRVRPLHEDFFALAQRDPHPAGGSLFRARLEADDARALSLYWDTFQLVPGARLFVYTPGGEQIRGAFTTENNADGGPFALSRLRGEAVILEVHEPNTPMDAAPQSRLVLNGLGHLYAPSLATGGSGKSFGSSDPCEINVNCGEGDDFRDPQRAVLQMEIRVNSTKVGECTVTLVNNTALDGRNYVLGAEHCALDPNGNFVPPSILQQWIFYFNYEAPGCNTPAFEGSLADQSMVGAQLRARSDGDGGD